MDRIMNIKYKNINSDIKNNKNLKNNNKKDDDVRKKDCHKHERLINV